MPLVLGVVGTLTPQFYSVETVADDRPSLPPYSQKEADEDALRSLITYYQDRILAVEKEHESMPSSLAKGMVEKKLLLLRDELTRLELQLQTPDRP
jgi:hypothetical protein